MSAFRKIYITSVACSGKTTFATNYPNYLGYQVIDYAQQLPKEGWVLWFLLYLARIPGLRFIRALLKNSRWMAATQPENYFRNIFSVLENASEPTVIFGRPPTLNEQAVSKVAIGVVMIPYEQHLRQADLRRQTMRNRLPFMHHWSTRKDALMYMRKKLRDLAEQKGWPVYDSFEAAIKGLAAGLSPLQTGKDPARDAVVATENN